MVILIRIEVNEWVDQSMDTYLAHLFFRRNAITFYTLQHFDVYALSNVEHIRLASMLKAVLSKPVG